MRGCSLCDGAHASHHDARQILQALQVGSELRQILPTMQASVPHLPVVQQRARLHSLVDLVIVPATGEDADANPSLSKWSDIVTTHYGRYHHVLLTSDRALNSLAQRLDEGLGDIMTGAGRAHVVWHSLQISQAKMVGSLLYCRPFTVLVRPTMVDTCDRQSSSVQGCSASCHGHSGRQRQRDLA